MKMAIVQRPDNSVAVIVPNHHKFTDAETDAAWFQAEADKGFRVAQPDGTSIPDGSVVVFVDDETVVRGKLPFADGSPSAPDFRRLRRAAMKWNASTQQVEDDKKVTTEHEVDEALGKAQEDAILKPDAARTPTERKLAAGRPDLVVGQELADLVKAWRARPDTPGPSKFVPPVDSLPPPPTRRRR